MHNPVSSDSKGRQDNSWLTDIEIIQAEIARDLEKTDASSEEEPSFMWSEPASAPETTFPAEILPDDIGESAESTFSAQNTAGFYRETIKRSSRGARSWGRRIAVLLLICTFGMGSLGFGLGAAYTWFTGQNESAPPADVVSNQETPTITRNRYTFDTGGQQTGTIADMIELVEPAVVSVVTRFTEGIHLPVAGTGTMFSENEDRIFIVTGSYVVPGIVDAEHFVRISGSQPLQARLVSSNMATGLSVISLYKVQLLEAGIESYTIAEFGDSSQMQVGDVVFAMGNARNEGISVTRGIVSAGKQDLILPGYTLTVLQTDAAINYGSSGGPLINLNGEVVGINIDRTTVALFGNASVEGIGYSIASNVVESVLLAMISPTRPGIGITGRTVTEEIAAGFGGIPEMGVFIVTVTPGGAADVAGIRPNDIITAFGGEPVFVMDELIDAIAQRQIDDVIEVNILRDGNTPLTLEIVLQAFIR